MTTTPGDESQTRHGSGRPGTTRRILSWLLRIAKWQLVLVLLTILVLRMQRLWGLPKTGPPFDVDEFAAADVPHDRNAFTFYRAADELLDNSALTHIVRSNIPFTVRMWADADPQTRRWLSDNRPALELWRRGMEQEEAIDIHPLDLTPETPLPAAGAVPDFSRLVLLEGLRLESAGDVRGALEWYLALVRCSRHSACRGTLMQRRIGTRALGVASIAIHRWASSPRATDRLLSQAIRTLHDVEESMPPPSEALKMEYFGMQAALRMRTTIDDTFRWHGPFSFVDDYDRALVAGRLELIGEFERSQRIVNHVMLNWLRYVDRPLQEWPRVQQEANGEYFAERASGTPLSPAELDAHWGDSRFARIWLGRWLTYIADDVRMRGVHHSTLTATLAVERFRRRHNSLPTELAAIADYVDELPCDPYGRHGELLRLDVTPDEVVIWSIGPQAVQSFVGRKMMPCERVWSDDEYIIGFRIASMRDYRSKAARVDREGEPEPAVTPLP